MFDFFKFLKRKKNNKKDDESYMEAGKGFSINESIKSETKNLKKIFIKPETYTGNRKLFDSDFSKKNIKITAFKENKIVRDPYTKKELVLTVKEAKLKYGEKWQEHLAEGDHITPLKNIVENNKKRAWLTNDDIKETANSKENMQPVSRTFNNAKRDRTNKNFVTDEEYLNKKGIKLSNESKEEAITSEKKAINFINKELKKRSIKNIFSFGHNAGKNIAQNTFITTATMSGILNIVAVIKGEKTGKEATKDIAINSTKSAVVGYALGGGGTVISHSLSSSSNFIKELANSNVPAKVITAVIMTGNIIKRYSNGEISTQECILELGEKGLNIATVGYSMTAGQALIPIPVVGAAVGALVGSVLTSKYYNSLINDLRNREIEHEERQRLINECKMIEREAKIFKKELERYFETYFKDYKTCFDEALFEIRNSFKAGNADGIISGANKITQKLGGKIYYNNTKEFKEFLESDIIDKF